MMMMMPPHSSSPPSLSSQLTTSTTINTTTNMIPPVSSNTGPRVEWVIMEYQYLSITGLLLAHTASEEEGKGLGFYLQCAYKHSISPKTWRAPFGPKSKVVEKSRTPGELQPGPRQTWMKAPPPPTHFAW
eukprot:TRINITY_DN212_c0_g1_i1.p2 TRINITY_DN212_c0_g1~~TRINITY_DN212_c0_g1_i1.p2  ORF type:complete len:130 (-),score=14.55 TRINITY_DN212_c0_g1_i1:2756-3145(-)